MTLRLMLAPIRVVHDRFEPERTTVYKMIDGEWEQADYDAVMRYLLNNNGGVKVVLEDNGEMVKSIDMRVSKNPIKVPVAKRNGLCKWPVKKS